MADDAVKELISVKTLGGSRVGGNGRFTAERVTQAIRETRGLVSLAARRLGCTPKTVYVYIHRYPSVRQALQEEREAMTDLAELALYNKIQQGEGWAVCFYLKTQGRDRGYIERYELAVDMVVRARQMAEAHGLDPDEVLERAKLIAGRNT